MAAVRARGDIAQVLSRVTLKSKMVTKFLLLSFLLLCSHSGGAGFLGVSSLGAFSPFTDVPGDLTLAFTA